MEMFAHTSGSRSRPCPFNRLNVWEEDSIPDSVRLNIIACVLVNSITSPVITAANILVSWSILKNLTLRRNNCKLLLAFLALENFLVGAVAQPLNIASRICRLKSECDPCSLDVLTDFFILTLEGASYYQLVLISGERYLAIQHALRYNVLVTFKKLMCAVVISWSVSLLGSVSFFFVPFGTLTFVLVVLAIVLSFLVIYCNIRVLIESKRHQRAIAAHVIRFSNQQNAEQVLSTAPISNNAPRPAEFKAGKTTALIVGVFAAFYTPLFISLIYFNLAKNSLPFTVLVTLEWTHILVHLNSLLNPFVYCWRISEIRRACLNNIRKIFCKRG